MSELQTIFGIDESQIQNKTGYESIISEMKCPLCMNIVCYPVECKKCKTLLCDNCHYIITLNDNTCITPGCTGNYVKANKFVREVLNQFRINCQGCSQTNMKYSDYLDHIQQCPTYVSNPLIKKINEIKAVDEELMKLKEDIKKTEESQKKNMPTQQQQYYDESAVKRLLTVNLPVNAKMQLYNTVVEGKLNEFKALVQRGYPVLEEISAKNYAWTPFHYAMHFGQWDITKYIMEHLTQRGILELALRMRSSDGRTPILCLLRSTAISTQKKRELLGRLLTAYPNVEINDELRKEIKGRDFMDVLRAAGRN